MKPIHIFYDYETCSKSPRTTQPLQLCAIAIDPIKLEIKENGIWQSYIRAVEDPEECAKLGVDTVQEEALAVNGITWEQIRSAPSLDVVWADYVNFIKSYGTGWDAPIRVSFNGTNFDSKIDDRLCKLYGQWDDKWDTQKLFHPIHHVDVMHDVYRWTYRNNPRSVSMDTTRKALGISTEMAHNAIKDCLDGAMLFIKYMKLYNHFTTKVKWEDSFAKENEDIARLLEKYAK